MAKRFTSTEIWEEDWFLEMPNEYKLFWYYMLSNCDHAGIYKVNLRSFSSLLEVKVSSAMALTYYNFGKQRIRVISEGLWFIEDFFVYQYGTTFNINNRLHESIFNLWQKNKIELTSIRGLLDLKDTLKDKDKDKEKKGGVGENKNEKVKGERFDDKFQKVILTDGTEQELGTDQKELAKMGKLKPYAILKNSKY